MNKTIELRSCRVDNSLDISTTSRAPLVQKAPREGADKISNIQIKIEKEFRKLNSITNIHKVVIYIYECLIIDVLANVYFGYELIQNLSDVTSMVLSSIYFFQYAISLWNLVMYLKIIITYNEWKKRMDQQKTADEKALKIKEKKGKIGGEESLAAVTLTLNKTLREIKGVIKSRIVTWIFKYSLYILITAFSVNYSILEFWNIFILLVDYFLFFLLVFYYKVILRLEAYKQIYKLEE